MSNVLCILGHSGVRAVDEGRQKTQVIAGNSKRLWSYDGKALKDLSLPPNPLLRLYFLACIFSEYKHGDTCIFSEIKMPPFLCQGLVRLQVFSLSLRYFLNEELNEAERRPIPPAIWSQQDVEFYPDSIRSNPFYFIVLPKRHPLRKIGAETKRYIDTEKAIICASMKDAGISYPEINNKFGWKPQKDSYGQKTRYPTAYHYVTMGRKLISPSDAKSKSNSTS